MEEEEDEDAGKEWIPKQQLINNNSPKFVDEILLGGTNQDCCHNFRMDKQLFYKLCSIFNHKGLLRPTNKINIQEQLAMFLFTIGRNQRTRAVQQHFHYSGETISRHFHSVLNAVVALSFDYFLPADHHPPERGDFHPYFKDCIGVVDGIHIPVFANVEEQPPFRNKDGFLSQNVLAACSFDLRFQYVLAGWEGCASDSRVLTAALTRDNKLNVPQGKYYLVDSEYTNMPGFIAPYPDIYNQLWSEESAEDHPANAQELFNQRHALLRNAMDRTFNVWKARFPILMSAPPYPLQTQVKLVVATCILHNYVRKENSNDWLFSMYEQQEKGCHVESHQVKREPTLEIESQGFDDPPYEEIDLERASQLRDEIASQMWKDYKQDMFNL